MDVRVGANTVHAVEHGAGRPVLVLHGAGVDHREAEACFDPPLAAAGGLRRIHPDLPGMGRTTATGIDSAEQVLDLLCGFLDAVVGAESVAVIAHSAGAHFALGLADREPARVRGLALVCPLLPGIRDVPEPRMIAGSPELGDDEFRGYFVIRTPELLERYERLVAPAAELVDAAAMERIGAAWELDDLGAGPFGGPTVVIAGRLDSTVGWAAAADLAATLPRATLAVLDDTGHALPHERPEPVAALLSDWLTRLD